MTTHETIRQMNLLAIDPGLQGTGFAVWTAQHDVRPQEVGVITARGESKTWIARVRSISGDIRTIVLQYNIRIVVCEMMEMHASRVGTIAWSNGDLQRTCVLIGSIHGQICREIATFRLTPPSEWKGQLPKSVTIRRVTKAVGASHCRRLNIKTHAWDAVGIGLWHKGVIS